jgi:hypothetical protein
VFGIVPELCYKIKTKKEHTERTVRDLRSFYGGPYTLYRVIHSEEALD